MEMNVNTSSTLTDKQYASLGQRFLALIIDFLLLSMVFFPVTRIVKGAWIMSSEDHRWDYGWLVTDPLCMVYLIVIVIYFVVLEGVLGATAGKGLMRLRVVRREGGHPGLKRALVRNLLRFVDALPAFNILGVILILLSPEKARFGDRVAGTRVVRSR